MADGRPKIEARSPKLLLQGLIRESLVLRRSAGFQTGLPCSTVARCPPSHPRALSRFGNRRSAKDSRMRPFCSFSAFQPLSFSPILHFCKVLFHPRQILGDRKSTRLNSSHLG